LSLNGFAVFLQFFSVSFSASFSAAEKPLSFNVLLNIALCKCLSINCLKHFQAGRVKGRVLSKVDKVAWFGVLCGFPVKKSIFVKTKTSGAVAGCGHFRVRDKVQVNKHLLSFGAVLNKQVKQTSKAREQGTGCW
jgi:hypothetical protein